MTSKEEKVSEIERAILNIDGKKLTEHQCGLAKTMMTAMVKNNDVETAYLIAISLNMRLGED